MKTQLFQRCLLAGTSALITTLASVAFGQGALAPTGAPAPTMKTLAQLEPRTPIASLPFTITNAGSYYLTTNLTGVASNPGITIATNNVTLDLNGFTLQGVPTAGTAVYMGNACTNVTVRNGTITGWANNGVYGPSVYNLLCERLSISAIANNYGIYCGGRGIIRDCVVQAAGGYGIWAANCTVSHCTANFGGSYGIYATQSTVRDCTAVGNSDTGIYTTTAGGCVISGCVALGNTNYGIAVSSGTVVENCQVQNNKSHGIYGSDSTMQGCLCNNNGGAGIYVWSCSMFNCQAQNNSAQGIYVRYSTVSGCLVQNNGQSGIWVELPGCQIIGNNCYNNNTGASSGQAGIYVNDADNQIQDNQVVGNGYAGITVASGYAGNVIVGNTSGSNGSNNYITNTISTFGPIITGAGTITSVNPWANFSY